MSSARGPKSFLIARPGRLTVPPLVPLLVAFAAGIVIDHHLDLRDSPTWINLALAASTVACIGLRWELVSSLAVLIAVLATGAAWHEDRWNHRPPDDLSWSVTETPRPAWVRGVITEMLGTRNLPGYGHGEPDRRLSTMVLAITEVSDGSRWRPATGRVLLSVQGDRTDLHPGLPIEAAGQLALIAGPLNPGELDHRAFLRARGIRSRLWVDSTSGVWINTDGAEWKLTRWLGALRESCRARLTAHLDDRAAPLAAALILGQRDEIDPEVNDAFARTGTTHLLAVSGLQLQAVAFFLILLFRALRVPRRPAYVAVAVFVVGYAVLVGLAASVVRSAVMTLAFCLAAIARRTARPANTLALAGVATLAWNPFFLFDAGCQLSFLAIAAIIWLVPPTARYSGEFVRAARLALRRTSPPIEELKKMFEPRWRTLPRVFGRWIAGMLITSAVVWLAAVPLVALRFHLVSPIGVLLNIPLIPLTSIALILGAASLVLGWVWAPLGLPLIWAADAILRLSEAIVRWGVDQRWGHQFVAGPSTSSVLAFYALLGLALTANWAAERGFPLPQRPIWRRSLWAGVALPLIPGWLLAWTWAGAGAEPGPAPTVEGHLLAVGHGLAVSLRLEDGHTILYDCGKMGDPKVGRRIIAPALWSQGITRIDEVYLSHADQDHFNALPDLLDRFRVGAVVVPPGFESERNPAAVALLERVRSRRIPVRTLTAPAAWQHGSTRFRVLHPPADWEPGSPDNARSLVLEVEHAGRRLLLTGDLDKMGVVELTGKPPTDPPVDLMLAPHHGGKTANTSMLYEWARPRAVMVSQRMPVAGTNDALAPLERGGIPLLRTWKRGAVRFQWSTDGIITEGFLKNDEPR